MEIVADNSLQIRPFSKTDWARVAEIYAEGIATKIATFETQVPDYKGWDKKYHKSCRLVAQMDNEVVGFAVLAPVSKREVYKGVAEVSVYVANSHQRQGIGKKLLETLVIESEANGFWSLQAAIFSQNQASIELHHKCGFRTIGVKERIGQLDGVWYDNQCLERRSNKTGL